MFHGYLLTVDEVENGQELTENGRQGMLLHEKRSLALMKDVEHEYFKPGQLVLEIFRWTSSAAKAGLLL